jgi:hypothetical protein
MDLKGDNDSDESDGQLELMEEALKEALACPAGAASKAYCAALLKLANGLSLEAATQVSCNTHVPPVPVQSRQ